MKKSASMKILPATFLLLSAFLLVPCESSYRNDVDFLKWTREHLPSASHEKLERIYPTWLRNADHVKNHHDERFSVSLNKFAHLVSVVVCMKTAGLMRVNIEVLFAECRGTSEDEAALYNDRCRTPHAQGSASGSTI